MRKLERLLNLTAALLETERPLTADELRQRVGGYPEPTASFRRAFERDKDDLREMGIPIALEPVADRDPPVDGYRIRPEDYYLDDPGLEPDELAALHLAARTIRLDGMSDAEALWKLGGAVGEPNESAPVIAALPIDPNVGSLFQAVAEHRVASFLYNGESRAVEPHRIGFQRGRWYLTGHDRLRDAERHFRVDKIESPIELGPTGGFERPSHPPSGLTLEPWQLGEDDTVVARLLVDADQADWAVHHVGRENLVERTEDGSVILELAVADEAAFRSFVATFLEHAEIVEPETLREGYIRWLEAMV